MEVELEDRKVLQLHAITKIDGVILPSWIVVAFGVLFVASFVVLGLVYQRQGVAIEGIKERDRIFEREIRVLQLHSQDVENVLIRNGRATREDFAAWEENQPKKKEE